MAEDKAMPVPQITDDKRITPGFLAQAGKGRPKGIPNKATAVMKEALQSVYNKLQDEKGGDHAHFFEWARDNDTEFYKLAMKLIPVQNEISGADGAPLGVAVIFQRPEGL